MEENLSIIKSDSQIKEDRAKKYSEEWNRLRISLGKATFTRYDLEKIARRFGVAYITLVIKELVELGVISKMGENENRIDVFRFNEKPIHHSIFIRIFDKQNIQKKKRDERERMEREKANGGVLSRDGRKPKVSDERILDLMFDNKLLNKQRRPSPDELARISDTDLVSELRNRGYDVTAKKTIEI